MIRGFADHRIITLAAGETQEAVALPRSSPHYRFHPTHLTHLLPGPSNSLGPIRLSTDVDGLQSLAGLWPKDLGGISPVGVDGMFGTLPPQDAGHIYATNEDVGAQTISLGLFGYFEDEKAFDWRPDGRAASFVDGTHEGTVTIDTSGNSVILRRLINYQPGVMLTHFQLYSALLGTVFLSFHGPGCEWLKPINLNNVGLYPLVAYVPFGSELLVLGRKTAGTATLRFDLFGYVPRG